MTTRDDKEKVKISKTETGKFFYDLSKSSFTITVLGSVASIINTNHITDTTIWAAISGLFLSAFFFIIGYKILNK